MNDFRFYMIALGTIACLVMAPNAHAQLVELFFRMDTTFLESAPLPGSEPGSPEWNFDSEGLLAGKTTFDVIARFNNPEDHLISLYSLNTEPSTLPMGVSAPCGCFESPFGSDFDSQISPGFFSMIPELPYDSRFLLDGMNGLPTPNVAIELAAGFCEWSIADGAIIIGGGYGIPAGDDLEIPIMRITACDEVEVSMCFQVRVQNLPGIENVETICLDELNSGEVLTLVNYCDEGSQDSDGDGICDEEEVAGCTDSESCNFSPIATDDDGTCATYDALGLCGGTCASDENENEICDEEESGCMNPFACNFDPTAVFEDGSCFDCPPIWFTLPTNSTVACAADLPENPPMQAAYDSCTGDSVLVISSLYASSDDPCSAFRTFRHLALNNACGTYLLSYETFEVLDTIPPSFTSFPEGLTIACNAINDWGLVEAVDACGLPVNTEQSIEFGEPMCGGTYDAFITVTATDECDNAANLHYVVHVVDTVAPVIYDLPSPVTLSCAESLPSDLPQAHDACSDWSWNVSDTELPSPCAGNQIIERSYTATDACGNASTATRMIQLLDTLPPTWIQLPDDIEVECGEEVDSSSLLALDECSIPLMSYTDSIVPGACENEFLIYRIHRATDECGNFNAWTQLISVVDESPPQFYGPSVVQVSCNDADLHFLTASDNCQLQEWEAQSVDSYADLLGQEIRIYQALDACGNIATEIQLIEFAPDQVCWGCTDANAQNFNQEALFDDGSCLFDGAITCPEDVNGDGLVNASDLLLVLAAFETFCSD